MYSLSTCAKAVIHYEHFSQSVRQVAKLYDIGKSTVARWVRAGLADLKLTSIRPQRPRRPARHTGIDSFVLQQLDARPYMTDAIQYERGTPASLRSASQSFRRGGTHPLPPIRG